VDRFVIRREWTTSGWPRPETGAQYLLVDSRPEGRMGRAEQAMTPGPSGRVAALAVALLAIGLGAGCGGQKVDPGPPGAEPPRPGRSAPLVLAPGAAAGAGRFTTGWEHGRLDDAMGIGRASGLARIDLVEVSVHDRRNTNNGRVRESSRTTTRTLRRGVLRAR
jgi:hypothetical protein